MELSEDTPRVLIVDDDDLTLRLLVRVIRRMGLPYASTNDAPAALSYYKEHHASIDLVVSDIVMPEMTGVELSRHILELSPDQKILLVSGYPAQEYEDVLELTGASFLAKPFLPNTLTETIHALLG